MKPNDFGITYEIRKRIKDVKMKKEIDFEHLESEILEMEKNVVTNKELKFAFAKPTNYTGVQKNSTCAKKNDTCCKKMSPVAKKK